MSSVPASRAILWLVVLGGLLASGCGSQGVKFKGRVLSNGQPYQVAQGYELWIAFVTGEPGQEIVGFAAVNPDGTFSVTGTGNEKKGLPPGTYRVMVLSLPYQDGDPAKDKFKGKYALAKTPLKVDINPTNDDVTIDVGAGTVTTQ